MEKNNKVLSIFLVVLFMFSNITYYSVKAQENVDKVYVQPKMEVTESNTQEGFTYSIYNGEVTIKGYTGTSTELIIPREIEGYPVVSIDNSAFYGSTALTSVEIPYGVRYIGNRAFYGCISLTSIRIPGSVEIIAGSAFERCSQLRSVELEEGIKFIDGGAFGFCRSLENIRIPSTVETIEGWAFARCSNLKSVEILNGVKNIGYAAFFESTSLISVEIPRSVTAIADAAFSSCDPLLTIYGTDGSYAQSYADTNGIQFIKKYPRIIEVTFNPNNGTDLIIKELSENQVLDYTPENPLKDGYTFIDWVGEDGSKYVSGESYTKDTSFRARYLANTLDAGISYYINNGAAIIRAYTGTETDLVIPNKIDGYPVTTIDNSAFNGNSKLISIELPDSLVYINNRAFYACTSLQSIRIPSSVKTIGGSAFEGCSSLRNVEIEEGVVFIDGGAFGACTSLETVRIPSSVRFIEGWAFARCSNLKSVEILKGVQEIGSAAFYNCGNLLSIDIPSSVAYIANGVFSGTSALLTIYGNKDSFVESYAASSNIDFIASEDVNKDSMINIADLATLSLNYNKNSMQGDWNSRLDVNKDRVTDIYDLVAVSKKMK